MPTVPTYQSGQIQDRPLSDVRVPVNLPIEAFGGGQSVQQLASAGEQLGGTIAKIGQEEKAKADEVWALSKDSALAQAQVRLQSDVLKMRGKDAFAAPDYIKENWEKTVSEASADASNDQQRMAILKAATARWDALNKTTQIHVADQSYKYDQAETKALLDTERTAIEQNAGDDEFIQAAKERQRVALTKWASRNGVPLDSATFQDHLHDELSKTNRDAIFAKIDSGNVDDAKAYLEAYKTEMNKTDERAAVQAIHADAIEKKRLQQEAKEQQKAALETIKDAFIKKAIDGTLSVKDVRNSPLDAASKEHYWKLLEADGKKTDVGTWNEIFKRIHLPDNDEEKLTDETELIDYVINGRLSKEDLNYFRGEMMGLHTEAGKDQAAMERGLYEFAAEKLSKKNALLGIKDPDGQEALLRFRRFAKDKIREAKQAGEPIDKYLDPTNKEWLGRSVQNYARSPQDIMKSQLQSLKAPSPQAPLDKSVPSVPEASGGAIRRKPGESAQDFLRRLDK